MIFFDFSSSLLRIASELFLLIWVSIKIWSRSLRLIGSALCANFPSLGSLYIGGLGFFPIPISYSHSLIFPKILFSGRRLGAGRGAAAWLTAFLGGTTSLIASFAGYSGFWFYDDEVWPGGRVIWTPIILPFFFFFLEGAGVLAPEFIAVVRFTFGSSC